MALMFLTAIFGASRAGSTTIGYTIKNRLGEVVSARSQAGVRDLGGGMFGADVDLPEGSELVVVWDDGTQPAPRYAFNRVDMRPESAVDEEGVSALAAKLDRLQREVQGLKEKNIRKVPDDPSNPTRIFIDVKKDEAPDWSVPNLAESYTVNLEHQNGEVRRYGG